MTEITIGQSTFKQHEAQLWVAITVDKWQI